MVTLCAEPGGFERTEIAHHAHADRHRFAVAAGGEIGCGGGLAGRGAPLLRADADGLEVRLAGASLSARFSGRRDWPRRAFGALGPAQVVPGLGQYWTPHLLSARVEGEAILDRAIDLTGAQVYAEKNWGEHFAPHWWWGQASFGDGAGVAFAGGRVHGAAPTAVTAWTPEGHVALAPPFARTTARASGGGWRIRARSPRYAVELEGEATRPPLRLPVPIPAERRLAVRSEHHLAARLRVTVHRGRRLWFKGESELAGLEDGRP
jgi:hypothetical protein